MSRPVLSTYRLQLRGPLSGSSFTLDDAAALVDYLDELGVTHLYLSPILTASAGSAHGYDVTDPTSVSAELGGIDGLAALSASAQARGMGLVVDIVPNHVGVQRPEQNAWWSDVLRHGQDSVYAKYFDIDWAPDNGVDGKLALPVLGCDKDLADLTVDGDTSDRVWRNIEPISVMTNQGGNLDGKGDSRVEIRAAHDGEWAYFLFTWEDPTRSLKQLPHVEIATDCAKVSFLTGQV